MSTGYNWITPSEFVLSPKALLSGPRLRNTVGGPDAQWRNDVQVLRSCRQVRSLAP